MYFITKNGHKFWSSSLNPSKSRKHFYGHFHSCSSEVTLVLWSNNMVSSYANSTKESLFRKDIINFLTTVFFMFQLSNAGRQIEWLDLRLQTWRDFLREAGHKNAIVKPPKSTKSDITLLLGHQIFRHM